MLRGPVLVVETPSSPHGHRYLVVPGREVGDDDAARLCSGLRREGPAEGPDWIGAARAVRQTAFGGGRVATARAVLTGLDMRRLTAEDRESIVARLQAILDGLDDLLPGVDWSPAARSLVVPAAPLLDRFDPSWDALAPAHAPRPLEGRGRSLAAPAAVVLVLAAAGAAAYAFLGPGWTAPRPTIAGTRHLPTVAAPPKGRVVAVRPKLQAVQAPPEPRPRPSAAVAEIKAPAPAPTVAAPAPTTGLEGAKKAIDRLTLPVTEAQLNQVVVDAFACYGKPGPDGRLAQADEARLFRALGERFAVVFRDKFQGHLPAEAAPRTTLKADLCQRILREIKATVATWKATQWGEGVEPKALMSFFNSTECKETFWEAAEDVVYTGLLADLMLEKRPGSVRLFVQPDAKTESWRVLEDASGAYLVYADPADDTVLSIYRNQVKRRNDRIDAVRKLNKAFGALRRGEKMAGVESWLKCTLLGDPKQGVFRSVRVIKARLSRDDPDLIQELVTSSMDVTKYQGFFSIPIPPLLLIARAPADGSKGGSRKTFRLSTDIEVVVGEAQTRPTRHRRFLPDEDEPQVETSRWKLSFSFEGLVDPSSHDGQWSIIQPELEQDLPEWQLTFQPKFPLLTLPD